MAQKQTILLLLVVASLAQAFCSSPPATSPHGPLCLYRGFTDTTIYSGGHATFAQAETAFNNDLPKATEVNTIGPSYTPWPTASSLTLPGYPLPFETTVYFSTPTNGVGGDTWNYAPYIDQNVVFVTESIGQWTISFSDPVSAFAFNEYHWEDNSIDISVTLQSGTVISGFSMIGSGTINGFFGIISNGEAISAITFSDMNSISPGALVMDSIQTAVADADPHFTGFLGQEFDFHGLSGKIMALFSDLDLQVNAYVSAPLDASLYYLGESVTVMTKIGIVFADLFTLEWHVLPKPLLIIHPELPMENDQLLLPNGTGVVRYLENHSGLEIEFADRYIMMIESILDAHNEDQWYINFSISLVGPPASQDTHGVLGQTLHINDVMSSTGPQGEGLVEGGMRDYFVSSLLASDFAFSAFEARMVQVEGKEHFSATASSSKVFEN